jgi:sortase A
VWSAAVHHNGRVPATRSGRRRVTLWVGVALMAGGAVLLAWVGWQLWGTNVVAKRQQREITASVENQWRTQAGDRRNLKPAYTPTGGVSALVRVPRFGKRYVVPVLEGTSTEVLSKGFGHFTRTADPGEVGNYALAAHRVTHGEPLRRMPDLRPGDEVIVETVDASFVYRIDTDPEKLVIPFTGVWVLEPVPENPQAGGTEPAQRPGQRLITLTTCSEIFHTDNRMIAFGHLVRTVERDR